MALYFVGDENERDPDAGIFYLDPHFINPSIPSSELAGGAHSTFDFLPYLDQIHCLDLRLLNPKDMCTSLAPGFYLRDHSQFKLWKQEILSLKEKYRSDFIFSVFERKPSYLRDDNNVASPPKVKNQAKPLDSGSSNSSFEDLNDFSDRPQQVAKKLTHKSVPSFGREEQKLSVQSSMGPEQVDSGMVMPKQRKYTNKASKPKQTTSHFGGIAAVGAAANHQH